MGVRRGFEKIVQPKAFDAQHGHLPVQPDDKSRVWGIHSFATLPKFGGVFREDVAQQCGFRTPASPSLAKGARSGRTGRHTYRSARKRRPLVSRHRPCTLMPPFWENLSRSGFAIVPAAGGQCVGARR